MKSISVLPLPSRPGGLYAPVVIHQGVAHVSGQLPRRDGQLVHWGRVGERVDLADAREAARLCAMQALAALDQELGGLGRLVRLLHLTGYVACTPEFGQQPQVVDAASGYLHDVLGARGAHARAAIGVYALPHGAPVEIVLTAAVRD